MIAGGLVSSQATASLFYDYDTQIIWYTEGPCPEIQLFKPLKIELRQSFDQGLDQGVVAKLGGTAVSGKGDLVPQLCDEVLGIKRWKHNNLLFRAVLKDYAANKERLQPVRTEYQNQLFELSVNEASGEELYKQAQAINSDYIGEALKLVGEGPLQGGIQFKRYWSKGNKALFEKEDDVELKKLYRRYLG